LVALERPAFSRLRNQLLQLQPAPFECADVRMPPLTGAQQYRGIAACAGEAQTRPQQLPAAIPSSGSGNRPCKSANGLGGDRGKCHAYSALATAWLGWRAGLSTGSLHASPVSSRLPPTLQPLAALSQFVRRSPSPTCIECISPYPAMLGCGMYIEPSMAGSPGAS
jgi:hypothetical protein